MKIKNIKTALSYEGLYSKPITTTQNYETDTYDLIQYVYKLTYQDEKESIVIHFTTEKCDIVPKWMCHYFSDQKQKKVSLYHPEVMSSLLKDSEIQLKYNLFNLKKGFMWDTSNGISRFIIDRELNSQENFSDIQILDLQLRDSNESLTYQKVGVYDLNGERPMIKSEYRHILEWLPIENKLNLFNLGIRQGKNPYPLFELNYSENNEVVNITTDVDMKILDVWVPYIMKLDLDSSTVTKIKRLLSDEIQKKSKF